MWLYEGKIGLGQILTKIQSLEISLFFFKEILWISFFLSKKALNTQILEHLKTQETARLGFLVWNYKIFKKWVVMEGGGPHTKSLNMKI